MIAALTLIAIATLSTSLILNTREEIEIVLASVILMVCLLVALFLSPLLIKAGLLLMLVLLGKQSWQVTAL